MNQLTLAEVLETAQSTELQGLGLKNDYKSMVNLLNLVLRDLHARFIINQGIIEIPIERDKEFYNLLEYEKDFNKD